LLYFLYITSLCFRLKSREKAAVRREKMTLGIIKKNEAEFANFLRTEWGFLTSLASMDGEPLVLEPYQLAFLRNRSRFRWVTKSRQVGFSFLFALEALARCHLRPRQVSVFVSYNQDDAKEKILIAKQVFDELPLAYQKRIRTDSKTELTFESNGVKKTESRIISAPSKAPRGKKGDIYLDELAHYINDREVYKGSTALILRSHGQLSGASTPLGRRGIFWEIACEELRKYPHHTRQDVPWWLCSFFCLNVRRAASEAPLMPTEQRVETFGRPEIVEQLDSLPLEDFQQEFENRFVDESYSFFPYELILPCTSDRLIVYRDFTDIPKPKGRIVAGFDVGRVRDRSELAICEEQDGRFICRLLRGYDQVPFADQEADLSPPPAGYPFGRPPVHRSQRHRHESGREPGEGLSASRARSVLEREQRTLGYRFQDSAPTARLGPPPRPRAGRPDPQH
jgi:hypothetical protein